MKLSTHTITTSSRGDRHRRQTADSPASTPIPPTSDEPASPSSQLSLTIEHSAHQPAPVNSQWLRDHLLAAIEHLPQLATANINILIADDQRMRSLHRQFMGLDSTTDVLTFDLRDNESSAPHIELALGVEVAQRQARERHHTIERELLLYALHGLLHTLDFDDHDEVSYARMHAEEDRILSAIGVGVTFDSSGESGGGES
jgi:probable rRNA maturation factor